MGACVDGVMRGERAAAAMARRSDGVMWGTLYYTFGSRTMVSSSSSSAAPRPNQALRPRSDIVGRFPVLSAWETPSGGSEEAADGVKQLYDGLRSHKSKKPHWARRELLAAW